jgi:cation diffusion facilitator CzcD-associated flavoprotein CzcO
MNVGLLIIGAGPFGLALAAYAKHHEIPHLVVGKPMEFWQANMPEGMTLRSGCDWHLDPMDVHTIDAYLATLGKRSSDVEPLPLSIFLEYAKWFAREKDIESLPLYVERLEYTNVPADPFRAVMEDGRVLSASHVVIAVGFEYFKHLPPDLLKRLPPGRFFHTCDLTKFDKLKAKRCLIIGGRQSAFEWAALINEAGAAEIHMSYRHVSPTFASSSWEWVNPILDHMVEHPAWFRNLLATEKEELSRRLWAEGRLKLEPWLKARVMQDAITLWPETNVVRCEELPNGELQIELNSKQILLVDYVILATGYRVDIQRVPFLQRGNILEMLASEDGFPLLDESFQTSVRNLFVTSIAANHDFGPFFAFTVGARASAKIMGRKIASGI